ncbi:caspase [Fusarium sp. NRRL 52700]|nr:caspase [Fusarium sp. NRRL 52700]
MDYFSFKGPNDSVIERAHDEPQPEYCLGCTSMINQVPLISKAVIVCIHYFNTRGQLRSHNASGIAAFLHQVYGCPAENIVILSDMYFRPTSQPTKRAILQSIHWLFSGSVPGDRLFFYSSGHGQPDKPIFPVDFRDAGCITEADIEAIMAQKLQQGVITTVMTDYFASAESVASWFDHRHLGCNGG